MSTTNVEDLIKDEPEKTTIKSKEIRDFIVLFLGLSAFAVWKELLMGVVYKFFNKTWKTQLTLALLLTIALLVAIQQLK